MAHFLIFVPGATERNRSILNDCGLGDLLREDDPEPVFAECPAGPDGIAGMIVLPYQNPDPEQAACNPALGFLPDRQAWEDHFSGKYWIGWETENPPGEADLRRSTLTKSRLVELRNGEPWALPNAFAQVHRMKRVATGWDRVAQFEDDELQADAAPLVVMLEEHMYREHLKETGEQDLPLDTWDEGQCMSFVCRLLSMNYRLNDFICSELGLTVAEDLVTLVANATDYERLVQIQREIQSGNYEAVKP